MRLVTVRRKILQKQINLWPRHAFERVDVEDTLSRGIERVACVSVQYVARLRENDGRSIFLCEVLQAGVGDPQDCDVSEVNCWNIDRRGHSGCRDW